MALQVEAKIKIEISAEVAEIKPGITNTTCSPISITSAAFTATEAC